jgi:hypothetical protein
MALPPCLLLQGLTGTGSTGKGSGLLQGLTDGEAHRPRRSSRGLSHAPFDRDDLAPALSMAKLCVCRAAHVNPGPGAICRDCLTSSGCTCRPGHSQVM